jgi:hypothetical protein
MGEKGWKPVDFGGFRAFLEVLRLPSVPAVTEPSGALHDTLHARVIQGSRPVSWDTCTAGKPCSLFALQRCSALFSQVFKVLQFYSFTVFKALKF